MYVLVYPFVADERKQDGVFLESNQKSKEGYMRNNSTNKTYRECRETCSRNQGQGMKITGTKIIKHRLLACEKSSDRTKER